MRSTNSDSSPERTRKPVVPSSTSLGTSPTSVATTARPQAMASITTLGQPSLSAVCARNDESANKPGTSSEWGTN